MATFTNLTSGGSTTDAASYATASVTPTGGRLILAAVHCYMATGSLQPPQPTVTGNGITYTLQWAQDVDTAGADRGTMWVFRGMSGAPTAGGITISFGGTTVGACSWTVDQSSGDVNTTGTNGSGAIVSSTGVTSAGATTLSVNYAPAMTSGNGGFAAFAHQVAQVKTPRAGWTELADVATVGVCSLQTQYINGTDTAGSATWATSSRAAGIILEVKTATVSVDTVVALGTATETDTALPLTRVKTSALAPASETDAAQPLARTKTRTPGPAAEVDAAQAIGRTKVATLVIAAGTDTPRPLVATKTVALGVATETDTARSVEAPITIETAPVDITVAIGPTRVVAPVTVGPTRTGLTVDSTRAGLEVGDTRTGLTVGPTRRDRGA